MLASPSGRVTIQHEAGATVIAIRAARDWSLFFIAFWLVGWATLPFKFVLATVHAAARGLAHPTSVQLFPILWSIGWLFGVLFATSRLLWALGGREILTLSPTELRLASTLFGATLRHRETSTPEIRNLRFVPSARRGRGNTPSKIAFEDPRGTVSFGSGLNDSGAIAVIEAMLAVYPFPKRDRALDYML